MNTIANVKQSEASHWYFPDGRSCYEVPYADPSKGMRPTTLRDAKKMGLIPSVTTILRVLDKPALTAWRIEQAVLAVLTTPKLADEPLDAFIKRVLTTDREQDAEASKARELGTSIHDALEQALGNWPYEEAFAPYVLPVLDAIKPLGNVLATEKIMVGEGYAGRIDAILDGNEITVVDFKTTKTLPKSSWTEHQLQLAAYAKSLGNSGDKKINTANIYISTVDAGKIVVCKNPDWQETFERGFKPILNYWQFANGF
jgi:ATP-dependent exoDNAse (exonuclease V) beta subunit